MSDVGKPGVEEAFRDGVRGDRRVADGVRRVDLDQLFVDVVRELLRRRERCLRREQGGNGERRDGRNGGNGQTHRRSSEKRGCVNVALQAAGGPVPHGVNSLGWRAIPRSPIASLGFLRMTARADRSLRLPREDSRGSRVSPRRCACECRARPRRRPWRLRRRTAARFRHRRTGGATTTGVATRTAASADEDRNDRFMDGVDVPKLVLRKLRACQ